MMMEETSIHDDDHEDIRDCAEVAADYYYLDIESGQCPWLYPDEKQQPRRRREGGSLPPSAPPAACSGKARPASTHQRPAAPAPEPEKQESKELVSCLAGSRRRRHRGNHAHASSHARHGYHSGGGGRAHHGHRRRRHHRDDDDDAAPSAPIDICETRRVTFDPSPLIQTLSFSSGSAEGVDKSALFYSRAECRAFRREVERELEQHRMLVDLVTLDEISIQPSKVNLNDDTGATEEEACRTVIIDREVDDEQFDGGDYDDDAKNSSSVRRRGLFGAGVFGGTYGGDSANDDEEDDIFSGALPIHDCDRDDDDLERSDPLRPASALVSCGSQGASDLSVRDGEGAGAAVWRERALQAAMVAAAAAACYCGGGLMDRWATTMSMSMSMSIMSDPW